MIYNIHPLLVHFPIALLVTYSVLELISFGFIKRLPYWFYVKAILVVLGTIGSYAAYVAGEWARDLINDKTLLPLIEKHHSFAKITIVIFTLLACGYLVAWIKTWNWMIFRVPIISLIWQLGIKIQMFVTETPFVYILALAGLVCLMITGALGGSITYGHANDPGTDWIYHLFFMK